MILEAVDCISTWLQHPTYGVNALLPSVPRLGTDPAPAAVAAVLDERTSGRAARGELPQDQATPVLLVGAHAEAQYVVPFDVGVRDATIEIDIAYAQRSALSEQADRDGRYTMVAVLQSLYRLWKYGGPSDRTRGSVSLVVPVSLRQVAPWTPAGPLLGDATITHALIAGYRVRETSP
jgi:hypothetical protein